MEAFSAWYAALPRERTGLPHKGSVAGGLIVLQSLLGDFNLDIQAHRTTQQGQLKGAGGPRLARILRKFGETRPFLSEGGRTSRGVLGYAESLLAALRDADIGSLPVAERDAVLVRCQKFLVERVAEYHNLKRLQLAYDPTKTIWETIHRLLTQARDLGKDGPIAEYLVGAKLQVRFPGTPVRNSSYSTADVQTGEEGDFRVGDAVFHVTVAPNNGHYAKCQGNLANGRRVYLIVPFALLIGTFQNIELIVPGRVTLQSVEGFVAQNVDELATFDSKEVDMKFAQLLQMYNTRVAAVETDRSLLIEIPTNLMNLLSTSADAPAAGS